ncbi:MAG TPA: hypothetical protein VE992_01935 [Solirubrobacteraceae bacterium]|nr:hypothetical protein [Solirubrobacteraceae bacterium]
MRGFTRAAVHTVSEEPTAHPPGKAVCGHTRHVGTCPCCQRAQLARWRAQREAAEALARR